MLDSLAAQTRFLAKRLEWHLLGNHLFVNAKALVVAGLFFEGAEADLWRETGWRILRAEIPEQILADGGQFERSPMYHALAVEDMLDLLDAMRAWPCVCAEPDERLVAARIGAMREFLLGVCHPDGEVAFFNDSVAGVAPTPAELEEYAARLGLPQVLQKAGVGVTSSPSAVHFAATGMVRLAAGDAVAIVDVGEIGPDYLPGHAHADTLSFELSIGGRRVLVNSGISQYGVGPERLRQRGTAAHNTVSVAGADSSEVWGGFRVARRARVSGVAVGSNEGECRARGTHDGFRRLPGGGTHTRGWALAEGRLTVTDEVDARQQPESHWHFAPGFELSVGSDPAILRASDGEISLELNAEGAAWRVTRSTYSPRFGVSLPNAKAVARFTGRAAKVSIGWRPCASSSSQTTSRLR